MINKFEIFSVIALVFALTGCSGAIPDTQAAQGVTIAAIQNQHSFSFGGVSLNLDPATANDASGEVVPDHTGEDGGPYRGVNPEFIKITLSGYPVIDSNYHPIIEVYPVEAFRNVSAPSSEVIDQLIQTLNN